MGVLVCGGAGYIGSHFVKEILKRDEDVVIIDNLSTGHIESIPHQNPRVKFYEDDIRNPATLDEIFSANKIDTVIHFAADALVGESVENPLKYFDNNTGGMISLLESMRDSNVKQIIFSSTAATYGEPKSIPILETDPNVPTNPYGESKLMMEKIMKWVDQAYGIRFVSLRYFNAAGASEDSSIGEAHLCETHLIPLILRVPLGQSDHITVFGGDYDTPDGTCIRDYIHVTDLADAHLKAIDYLRAGKSSDIFNLGNGQGFSVKEMISAAEKVTGQKIKTVIGDRRPGDPARLVASSEKAKKILGWNPKFTSIEKIIETAWNWHVKNPRGYES